MSRNKHQILKDVYDADDQLLRIILVGTDSGNTSNLDEHEIWEKVYDEANSAIRVVSV